MVTRRLPIPTAEEARIAASGRVERSTMTDDERWESYLIPGTSRVLRNKLDSSDPYGVRDYQLLDTLESEITLGKVDDLLTRPIRGNFDLEHMQRIHRYLLGDVYDWAGQIRDVNMSKRDVAYASHDRIETIWKTEHARIAKRRFLRQSDSTENFALGLARFWGEVNHAHAFREGNTRSQMVFFEQLADQAGRSLAIERFAPQHPASLYDTFVDARFYFQRSGDLEPLAEVIMKALSQPDNPQRVAATRRFPELGDMRIDRSDSSEIQDQPELG
ncbi:MAG: Fic family protein [Mycetocola sp.]